jgi:hypothetical protein
MSEEEEGTNFVRAKIMICPHCQGEVRVGLKVQLIGELQAPKAGTPTHDAAVSKALTDSEAEALRQAEQTGLLSAFSEALLGGRRPEQLPSDHSHLFLLFFKKATPKAIPQFALKHYIREFSPAQIEVWGAEGVAAILADRVIKAFVPYKLLRGQEIKSLGGHGKARMNVNEEEFSAWVRTKHGYIVGKGAFFNAMQQKSRGDFAKLVQ